MSLQIICSCGKKYKVKNELAGKQLKCPSCKNPIRIPALKNNDDPLGLGAEFSEDALAPTVASPTSFPSSSSASQTNSEFRSASGPKTRTNNTRPNSKNGNSNKRSHSPAKAYQTVNRGVMFVLAGALFGFVLPLFARVAFLFGENGAWIYITLVLSGTTVCSLISMAGYFFCTKAPPESNSSVFAWIALVSSTTLFSFGLLFGFYFVLVGSAITTGVSSYLTLGIISRAIILVPLIINSITIISFLIFLGKLGNFTGRTDISEKAQLAMFTYLAMVALNLIVAAISMAFMQSMLESGRPNPEALSKMSGFLGIVGILGWIAGLLSFAWHVFYCFLLFISRFRAPEPKSSSPTLAAPGWKTNR